MQTCGPHEGVHANPASVQRGSPALAEILASAASFILSADKGVLANLEQKLKRVDEECRIEESRLVDLELNIMEVKDNLKKAEAGPVTLGTAVDTTHLDNMSPRVSAGHCSSSELYAGLLHTGGRDGLYVCKPIDPALVFLLRHNPKLPPPPPPQTLPQSTLPPCSRTGLFPSWSQAKAPSYRKPR